MSGLAINRVLRRLVYRSRTVTRMVYGTRVEEYEALSFWELGSLALHRILGGCLCDGMRVADVGAGPYAILALWALSRWRLDVIATDIDRGCVDWARRTAALNARSLDIRCCDLLSEVSGPLDAAWFHAPWMARREVDAAPNTRSARRAELDFARVCGGEEGWETIDRFYAQAFSRLRSGGRAYVCVNLRRQRHALICKLITENGFSLRETIRWPVVPHAVYIAERAA